MMKLFHLLLCALAFTVATPARADTAPDELIRQVSVEVIDTVKADKAIQNGDVARIVDLVDAKVMPHVNFQRMTASAVGRNWRSATPEQQKRLQEEFGSHGIERLGGEQALLAQLALDDLSLFEQHQALRQRLLTLYT